MLYVLEKYLYAFIFKEWWRLYDSNLQGIIWTPDL